MENVNLNKQINCYQWGQTIQNDKIFTGIKFLQNTTELLKNVLPCNIQLTCIPLYEFDFVTCLQFLMYNAHILTYFCEFQISDSIFYFLTNHITL